MITEWDGTSWAGTAPRKAEVGPGVAMVTYGTPLSSLNRSPQKIMREAQAAYHTNEWIGLAESIVTRKAVGLPWHLEDTDEVEIDDTSDPKYRLVRDLLEKPQAILIGRQQMTRRDLMSITSRHVGLCGMAYWYLDQLDSGARTPLAILYINPARMWPHSDAAGNLDGWILDARDDAGNGGVPLELDEVLPFRLEWPDWGHLATGLVERVWAKSQITGGLDRQTANILMSGGRLPGIVSPRSGLLSGDEFKTLVNEFRSIRDGDPYAKRDVITSGPVDFVTVGANTTELNLTGLSDLNRDDILANWGVPPSQAGVRGEGGLNSGETKGHDYEILMTGSVHDRVQALREPIQFGLLDRWKAVGVALDLEIAEPEFDDRAAMFTIAAQAAALPLRNIERRELVGYDPLGPEALGKSGGPLDDEVWLPATQTLAYSTSEKVDNTPEAAGPSALDQLRAARAAQLAAANVVIPGKAKSAHNALIGLRKSVDERVVPTVKTSVGEVLRAQARDIAARVRALSSLAGKTGVKKVWHGMHWSSWDERLEAALRPHVAGIAETVTKRASRVLGKASFEDEVAARILRHVASRVKGINETTRAAIAAAIERGFDEGLSPAEVAELLEGLPAFDEARAELVARTETMFAYNAAALESYKEFGLTEVQAIDGDQDEACAERNGQVYSIEEAEGIEDHPNGTLDWVPYFAEDKVAAASLDVDAIIARVKAELPPMVTVNGPQLPERPMRRIYERDERGRVVSVIKVPMDG